MKKMMIIAVALSLTVAASAQRGHGFVSSRIYIASPAVSFGYGYSPFYYTPFGYYPFGYPYGYYNNGYRSSSKLQMQIDGIKSDYKDKIKSAKHDKTLSREERNKIVSQLESDRDKEIHDLKTNYYKSPKTQQNQSPQNKNQNQDQQNSGNSGNNG